MTLEAEVVQIQVSLKKAVKDSNIEAILDMLKALSILLITRDVLSATKIGVDVNGIAKAFSTNKVVQTPAAALVKQWKEVAAQAKAERQSSRPKKEINYNEEKQEAAAGSSSSQAVSSSDDPALKMKMKTKISKKIGEGPLPKRNEHNEWCFSDFPEFRPNLSPMEVLQMGSFGGTYFRPIKSGCTGLAYGKEVWQELPEDWLKGLNISKQVANPVYSASLNRYKVKCGGDLDMWESSGWMRDSDPYGWFQWYCRFFQGRRCSDDDRQVRILFYFFLLLCQLLSIYCSLLALPDTTCI
jgi:hypothetical protein